jgi:hypothetical protein
VPYSMCEDQALPEVLIKLEWKGRVEHSSLSDLQRVCKNICEIVPLLFKKSKETLIVKKERGNISLGRI